MVVREVVVAVTKDAGLLRRLLAWSGSARRTHVFTYTLRRLCAVLPHQQTARGASLFMSRWLRRLLAWSGSARDAHLLPCKLHRLLAGCAGATLLLSLPLSAAVLPEDAAEAMYHSYQGGGMDIDGPALLIRKKVDERFALSGKYYVDAISGASVDVVTTASPYSEKRNEYSVGANWLHGRTLVSADATRSSESDYDASTYGLSVSQEVFGDLTTVTLGFAYGDDTVGKRGDDSFSEPAEHRRYQLGLSQILTANWVVGLNLEAVVDDGYLNNPYRSVRYRDSSAAKGYSYQPELYPGSRNGGAIGVISSYYLPWRAAVDGYYRYYGDSWDIRAHSLEFEYRHALGDRWILSGRANLYRQDQAEFYSDLFAYADAQNYLARDKELASFSSWTLGLGARYSPPWPTDWPGVRPELLLEWDFINFDYDNFRDLRATAPVGEEPLYSFTANVVRASLMFYY